MEHDADNTDISIHALLAESDARNTQGIFLFGLFLSTLSLRRATRGIPKVFSSLGYFYPRSPCGERQEPASAPPGKILFLSTLSLRRATAQKLAETSRAQFLSTLSLRRATHSAYRRSCRIANFYPRSPCGERRYWSCPAVQAKPFLSTLSLRRATRKLAGVCGFPQYFYPRSPCGERLIFFSIT